MQKSTAIKKPKSEEVAEKLSASIMVEKKYLPGQKLPDERTMAQIFGVSRTSIREALKIISGEGIVDVKKGNGIFVADNPGITIDPLRIKDTVNKRKMLQDWYTVRLALEPEIVNMVANNATDEEIDKIETLEKEEAEKIKKGEENFLHTDRSFHLALANATHNEIMMRLIPTLQQSVYYGIAGSEFEDYSSILKENALVMHNKIVAFLKKRDAAGAMMAMRFHILQAIEDMEIFDE